MDRLIWHSEAVNSDGRLAMEGNVCLYDGDEKTAFESGTLLLFPTRIIWIDAYDPNCKLALDLSLVVSCDKKHRSFTRSAKIVLNLVPCPANLQGQGPVSHSNDDYIKLSFRQGGEDEVYERLERALREKAWEKVSQLPGRRTRAGIVGIERRLQESHRKTSHNIHEAFEDMDKLMNMAKDMVTLSKSISEKIRMKQGEVTEDETVKFKSYLLSLGIQDPVTKETHGTGDQYYKELARQLASVLIKPLEECGGMMALTDVYCRVNRARGLELLSPEDLINACKMLNYLRLPVRLHTFDSGVSVLILHSQTMAQSIEQTEACVIEQTSLSAEELAQMLAIPVILAKERLLCSEDSGRLCRDETVEGLRFYPNLFLNPPSEDVVAS